MTESKESCFNLLLKGLDARLIASLIWMISLIKVSRMLQSPAMLESENDQTGISEQCQVSCRHVR